MSINYDKFRTPFFEVSVGDSTGSRMVPLPHHINRLISRVEIIETWEENGFNTVNITFLEGSREPASPDQYLGTEGLYKITSAETGKRDLDVAGSLTNRTGIIPDLRFSGSGGITFTTAREKRQKAIDTSEQKNINNDTVTRSFPNEPRKPLFLFQERNQIRVKWGYKEDPATHRTIRTYIMMVAVKYPQSGQVETTVTCQDTTAALDQITTTKGVPFGFRDSTPSGGSVVEFTDKTTEETIQEICQTAGIDFVISKNLPVPSLDTDHQKVWLAGESFKQFMWKLAKMNNAIFKVIPDPESGRDKLYFIKKSDFEKQVLVSRRLLDYKNPGSILKSLDLRVDFGIPQGTSTSGVNKDGVDETAVVEDPAQSIELTAFENPGGKKEERIDKSPVSETNPIAAAKGIAQVASNSVAGDVEVTPDNNIDNKEKSSATIEEDKSRVIQLDFNTIGYTKLTPGTVDIAGLGVRYSGKYRIMTATHTLSADSYETRCQATSMAVGAGGVVTPAPLYNKDKEPQEEDQVQLRAFDSPEEEKLQKELEKIR
jgi:hypothetical protein